jgi:hypothetical protein
MATQVEIINRGLQLLGAKRITSITEDSRNARAMNAAYEPVKEALLRKHTWVCATKRAQLAASSTAPAFGKTNAFPVPSDFIRLLPLDPEDITNDDDRIIEGRSILTDEDAPLNVRYVYNITDPNEMDPLFREALAASLAEATCEEITQSNTKMATIMEIKKDAIAEAKKANAIEKPVEEPPEDTWVTCRS